MTDIERVAKGLTDSATDAGLIIETGFLSMMAASFPQGGVSKVQYDEMRNAFFAGAQHLFASIMTVLDPDAEPTERDLKRMQRISDELDRFIADYVQRNIPTKGTA